MNINYMMNMMNVNGMGNGSVAGTFGCRCGHGSSVPGLIGSGTFSQLDQMSMMLSDQIQAGQADLAKMVAKEQGKAKGNAIGGTIGSVVGTIAGTIIAPGVGTAIGGMLGGAIGGGIGKLLGGLFS